MSTPQPTTPTAPAPEIRQWSYPPWVFVTIAIVGLGLVLWLCVLLTLRTANQLDYWTTRGWFVGWSWAVLTVFALVWGGVNVYWARQAACEGNPLLGSAHLVLAICSGVACLGLHGISAARSSMEGPQIVDPQSLLPEQSTVESLSGPIYGKANKGKAWFALTCATCHGPTGDGLNNLAPSLRESEFLKTADAVGVNLLIRRGRAITDPENKSGKPMPPRGADPTVTDDKVADLVAFVMSLHDRSADPDTLSWDGIDSPPPSLSIESLKIRKQNPTVRKVNVRILMVHGVFVAAVLIHSLTGLAGTLSGRPSAEHRAKYHDRLLVSQWLWMGAVFSWLIVLMLLS